MRYIQIDDVIIGQKNKYVFKTLSGFAEGDTERQTLKYINADGEEYSNITFQPRKIEIHGTILAKNKYELSELKQRLSKACNPRLERDVYYFDGIQKYYARVVPDCLPEYGGRIKNSWFVNFSIYLIIPGFWWYAAECTNISIAKRVDTISTSFTLPCTFTERTSEAAINNDTDFEIYPEIIIKSNISSSSATLKIVNETIGETIILSGYEISQNETITINCDLYTAYNQDGENLINYFNDFEAWCIIPGENTIKGLVVDNLSGIDMYIKYKKRYLGV